MKQELNALACSVVFGGRPAAVRHLSIRSLRVIEFSIGPVAGAPTSISLPSGNGRGTRGRWRCHLWLAGTAAGWPRAVTGTDATPAADAVIAVTPAGPALMLGSAANRATTLDAAYSYSDNARPHTQLHKRFDPEPEATVNAAIETWLR